MNRKFSLICFCISLLIINIYTIEVPIFTYHTNPPFIISNKTGLTYDLAQYLTEKSDGKYLFVVKPMSRIKVDYMISEKKFGIIPWVNPDWFKSQNNSLLWSEDFLFSDGNVIISHKRLSLEYSDAHSLVGLRLGGIIGHHYLDIDPLVEVGEIVRFDAENLLDNLRKVVNGKIDITLIPKTSAGYLITENNLENDIYLSRNLHSSYERKVIIIGEELYDFINGEISDLKKSEYWKELMKKYSIIE